MNMDSCPGDLAQIIADHLGESMVTEWVIVANCTDADGRQTLQTLSSPGLMFWQKHGLLSVAAAAALPQPDWMLMDMDDQEDES